MKYILLFILFICSSNIIKAQDTLSTRYGESILVKVIEVGTSEVKYKKLDNLNGPVFSMLKSDLLMIKYANGTSEDYGKEERTLIKVKKRHTLRNIGIVCGVLGIGVLIDSKSWGSFRGGFFGLLRFFEKMKAFICN